MSMQTTSNADFYDYFYNWDDDEQNAHGVDPCGTYPCGCCGNVGELGCDFYYDSSDGACEEVPL